MTRNKRREKYLKKQLGRREEEKERRGEISRFTEKRELSIPFSGESGAKWSGDVDD